MFACQDKCYRGSAPFTDVLLVSVCSVLLVQNIEDVDEIVRAVKRYRCAHC